MKTRDDYERELREYLDGDQEERRRRQDAYFERLRGKNEAVEARREKWHERMGHTSWTCDAGRPWR